MQPQLLFLSGFLPSARVPSGGQQLVHRIMERMAEDHEITLFTFRNEHEAAIDVGTDFSACQSVRIFPLNLVRRALAGLRHPTLPLITSARYAAAHHAVRSACRRHPEQSVWCEFIQAASLLSAVPASIPTTLVVHDLFHEALERRAARARGARRWFWHLEARRTKSWEATILRRPTHLVTLTERDRATIQALCGRTDVEVRYPEPGKHLSTLRRGPGTIEPGTLLFFGLMSRRENEEGILWFLAEVWPAIRQARPHARLIIAGANPSATILAHASAAVAVTGFIEHPAALFERATIAIAPLRLGSGVKIKVIESLAAGIPTVATAIGAEGIRSSPLLTVADSAPAFAAACVHHLSTGPRD